MSKVGNKPVIIESGATIAVQDNTVVVTGPKGTLTITLPDRITAKVDGNTLTLARSSELKDVKALHGTFRSLIANAVHGVTKGWEKRMEVVGTGYGVTIKEGNALFKVGYSHQVLFPKVEGLTFTTDGPTLLVISGIDRQLVGQTAYKAKMIKRPDPYKGKGVKYAGEVIKLKAGKKTKAA